MRYSGHNLHPTNHIHYGWTGWPSNDPFPALPSPDFLPELCVDWKKDGLQLLTPVWETKQIQLTFAANAGVSPILFTQRVKGRLQHALRKAGCPTPFSRKATMRSLGDNVSGTVSKYVQSQVRHANLADPRYSQMLGEAAFSDSLVNLAHPSETKSGRYWYNLHLVLVTSNRFRMGGTGFLKKLQEACLLAADANECRIADLSIMPDHLHVAIRGNLAMSPRDIGLTFQNESARAAGCRLWQEDFYVGTFSEYDLDALRIPPN